MLLVLAIFSTNQSGQFAENESLFFLKCALIFPSFCVIFFSSEYTLRLSVQHGAINA